MRRHPSLFTFWLSSARLRLDATFAALLFAAITGLSFDDAKAQPNESACTLRLDLNGTVSPATVDAFERVLQTAEERSCDSILFLINTPGGNLQSTRLLVEAILTSRRPVLCLVWPPGGHAGSAGAILLQACHVSGAAPATNIGAATPISGSGSDLPEDLRNKIVEDTKSWVLGLARLRGRNQKFAEESVTKARSLDAEEAVQVGAIDTLARDIDEFLRFAQGRPVKMPGDKIEAVEVGPVETFESGLRHRFLDLVTDPQIAYLLFMVSLGLLYLEFTSPGLTAPGVLGSLGLVISLISFHKLDVWWGGVALIVLGVGFLVAEIFIPSFGVIGIGGLIALATGSLLLFDPLVLGGRLSYGLVLGLVGTVGVGMLLLGVFVFRSRAQARRKKRIGLDEFIGEQGNVVSLETPSRRKGMLEIKGEIWRFQSDRDVDVGANVDVSGYEGLILKVNVKARE